MEGEILADNRKQSLGEQTQKGLRTQRRKKFLQSITEFKFWKWDFEENKDRRIQFNRGAQQCVWKIPMWQALTFLKNNFWLLKTISVKWRRQMPVCIGNRVQGQWRNKDNFSPTRTWGWVGLQWISEFTTSVLDPVQRLRGKRWWCKL